jgi:hypothetical protein
MRCNICDSLINKPVWNSQIKTWEPCTTCLEVINNVFEDPVAEDAYAEEEDEDEDFPLDNSSLEVYNIFRDGSGKTL